MAISAAAFKNDMPGFASSYCVLVSEHLPDALKPNAASGTRQQLNAANYVLNFTIDSLPTYATNVVCHVWDTVKPGSIPLYFLPWQQNAATEMTLAAGPATPDVFMTSMLNGCTVQVTGPRTAPTVVHANARDDYTSTYDSQEKTLSWLKIAKARHSRCEERANRAAQGKINSMLLAPAHGLNKTCTKLDYVAHYDKNNRKAFLKAHEGEWSALKPGYEVTGMKTSKVNKVKPAIGGFVFGRRSNAGNWKFYYQSNLMVHIEYAKGALWWRERVDLADEGAVLGPVVPFYP